MPPDATSAILNTNTDPAAAAAAAAPATGAAAAAPAAAAANASWFDAKHATVVEAKQWKSANDVIEGYANLEKLARVPADKILNRDDPELWTKLGVPAKPEDYKLEVPDGGDKEFGTWAAGAFKAANIPVSAAQAITKAYNEYATQRVSDAQAAVDTQFGKEEGELRNEWGSALPKNAELIKRVAADAGFTNEQIVAMAKAPGVGAKALFAAFAKLGRFFAEDGMRDGGGSRTGAGMSPDEASATLNGKVRADKTWLGKANTPGTPENREYEQLMAAKAGMSLADWQRQRALGPTL